MTELEFRMRVSRIQHTSMAKFSSIVAKHACCPIRIIVHKVNVASSKWHRGRRKVSADGSEFGGVWILVEGENEGAQKGLLTVTLLLLGPGEFGKGIA